MEIADLKLALDGYQSAAAGGIADLGGRVARLETAVRRPPLASPATPHAIERDGVSRAFAEYLRSGEHAPELKALSIGVDPEGGYAVSPAMSDAITRVVFDTSPIRRHARVVAIQSDAFEELVDKDDVVANWANETSARTETASPALAKLRIPAHEIYAMPKATQQVLEDANFDIEGWLAGKLADRFARRENTAFVTGNGVGQPRGFASYAVSTAVDSARPWGTLQYVASGAAGGFAASNPSDQLIALLYSLKADYRDKATWMMNRDAARRIRQFKDAQGSYLWQPAVAAGQPDMLMGFPVTLAEDMPAIAADSLSLAFGNFAAGYTIVDRTGVAVLRDPYSAKPHVLFYTRKRVGGDVTNFDAIKLMKFAVS
jgi:HK97 family phage major capsid protein